MDEILKYLSSVTVNLRSSLLQLLSHLASFAGEILSELLEAPVTQAPLDGPAAAAGPCRAQLQAGL